MKVSHKHKVLLENNVSAILSLTDGQWAWWNTVPGLAGIPKSRHKWVQCADSSTQDLLKYMSDMCDFINKHAPAILQSASVLSSGPTLTSTVEQQRVPAVFVHCDLGRSRSPSIITAYIMRKFRVPRDEALAFVKTSRERIRPSSNLMRQLQVWEEVSYQIWEEDEKTPKAPYQAFLEDRAKRLKEKRLTGNEPLAPTSL